MGFISFHETYYRNRLEAFESYPLSKADIYEIRQLLKVLEDLEDEGFTRLNRTMEADFACLSRLRALLKEAGVTPFPIDPVRKKETVYTGEEYELESLLETLRTSAANAVPAKDAPFLEEIFRYSKWIGHAENTLLPFVYHRGRTDDGGVPWLISRRFLAEITGIPDFDDEIRLPVYEALESGKTAFEDFCAYCTEHIRAVVSLQPKLKMILKELLASIPERRIVVVESGYVGTIPMLLRAMDERVEFRLYTTAPFLFETCKDFIYCRRYEDIRRFETVVSQDLLLRFASFRDGKFYVNCSIEESVRNQSLRELRRFLP